MLPLLGSEVVWDGGGGELFSVEGVGGGSVLDLLDMAGLVKLMPEGSLEKVEPVLVKPELDKFTPGGNLKLELSFGAGLGSGFGGFWFWLAVLPLFSSSPGFFSLSGFFSDLLSSVVFFSSAGFSGLGLALWIEMLRKLPMFNL